MGSEMCIRDSTYTYQTASACEKCCSLVQCDKLPLNRSTAHGYSCTTSLLVPTPPLSKLSRIRQEAEIWPGPSVHILVNTCWGNVPKSDCLGVQVVNVSGSGAHAREAVHVSSAPFPLWVASKHMSPSSHGRRNVYVPPPIILSYILCSRTSSTGGRMSSPAATPDQHLNLNTRQLCMKTT